ncbi:MULTISPECIES: YSC84-related protein [Variovorax]|jgi:lipid-binding SYLF domain-containing protein|uniref:Twin-arginine translocation pathway signal n=1 Tax=Variovorax boronicumulans TaxID=436515 RepID=A0A250DJ08_9BURK|nr:MULTISPECIES: YSC84-related protein [Variovorax]ATA54320.1 twin-arginine translocation pathway signal [Variovorax boronicumulans]MDP9909533.1 lipid-binding SYLF domain-containing protein [Variovorax boronicumulans]TSD60438.1 twin-arginine translocation pathway signal [Variovorax sp. KBS0712]GER11386.1 twin-arginine translocation pathway signal [Variovorax boronicumulans]GER16927.1 twin-arginine translocation pathway signal [Variovorax boronicumulans]
MHVAPFHLLAAAAIAASLAVTGCTVTRPSGAANDIPASSASAIDAQVDASLARLYDTVAGSRALVAGAQGVLVFPSVVGGSFGIGADYGRGALRSGGRTQSYYSTTAGSIGFQAGAQSKAVFYVFTSREALDKFRQSRGWTVGVDATVALARYGANGVVDSSTFRQPVVAFVMTNVGLEAGASVQGAKVTEIRP